MKIVNISFIVISIFLLCILIFSIRQLIQTFEQGQQNTLTHQKELQKKIYNNGQTVLMNSLLSRLKEELAEYSTLKNESIRSIAALSHSFQEYHYEIAGQQKEYSPERGQLLLRLALMKIDSVTFINIKKSTSFAKADLSGLNLSELDLSGINLCDAQLREADLEGTNLKYATLKDADLWAAQLKNAKLQHSNFFEAKVQWADLTKANLAKADIRGADFSNAKFRNAQLIATDMQWGIFHNASFHHATMDSVNLYGADLKQANLIKVNLSNAFIKSANLSAVNMNNANLLDADLIYAGVEADWLDRLKEWQVLGADSILAKYEIAPFEYKKYNYRLMPKK